MFIFNGATTLTRDDGFAPAGNAPFSVSFDFKCASASNVCPMGWGTPNAEECIYAWFSGAQVGFGNGEVSWNGGPTITDNTLHRVVGTYDGAGNYAVYLDGSNVASYFDDSLALTPGGSTWFQVGAYNGNPYSGSLGKLAVWNVQLAPSDAEALSARSEDPPALPTGLLAYWPLLSDLNDTINGYNLNGPSDFSLAVCDGRLIFSCPCIGA